jgi:uncharacterized membrane protein
MSIGEPSGEVATVESRLRVQGHPIQPMLVTFPFGLFVCAAVFDLTDVLGGPVFLGEVGYLTVGAALVAAALAAIAGMVDLWDTPNDSVRRIAVRFNLVNAAMAALFVLACLVRARAPDRGANGGILVVELLALVIGAIGVRLGVILMRSFDHGRGEAGSLDTLETMRDSAPGRSGQAPGRSRLTLDGRGRPASGHSRPASDGHDRPASGGGDPARPGPARAAPGQDRAARRAVPSPRPHREARARPGPVSSA